MKRILDFIKKNEACKEGYIWSKNFDNPKDWWEGFNRGDWMLWVIGKCVNNLELSDRKKLVACVCKCARLALPYITEGEKRPLKAIETAEAWANDDNGVSLKDVKNAAADAAYAAYAAYTAAAASADDAASTAAYADKDAVYATA